MCDLHDDVAADLIPGATEPIACTTGANRRGDLLVCDAHASRIAWNVGRVPGEVRCSCGYWRAPGEECGLPCNP